MALGGMKVEADLRRLESSVKALDGKADKLVEKAADVPNLLEEHFEALADTVLKPVGEVRAGVDGLTSDLAHGGGIRSLLEKAAKGQESAAGKGKYLSATSLGMSPTSFMRMEEKQKETLEIVRETQAAIAVVQQDCRAGFSAGKDRNLVHIRGLVELLKRVEHLQVESADRRIKYQADFNQVFERLACSLESVLRVLHDREDAEGLDQSEEVTRMKLLCADVNSKINGLSELETRLQAQTQEDGGSTAGLSSTVAKLAEYLKVLLRRETTMGGGGEGGGSDAEQDYQQIYDQFPGTAPADQEEGQGEEDVVGEEEEEEVKAGEPLQPPSSESDQLRAHASSKGLDRKRPFKSSLLGESKSPGAAPSEASRTSSRRSAAKRGGSVVGGARGGRGGGGRATRFSRLEASDDDSEDVVDPDTDEDDFSGGRGGRFSAKRVKVLQIRKKLSE